MAAQVRTEVGFAEFVGQLVAEVFDAVVSTEMTQEQRLAEMVATASLSLPEAGSELSGSTEVDAELALLFPPPRPGVPHGALAGAPYRPAGPATSESPGLAAALGVTLSAAEDFRPDPATGHVLTEAGAQKVRDAVRQKIAAPRLAALRRMAARGVPRVVVEAVRVTAAFTVQLQSAAPAAARSASGTVKAAEALTPAPGAGAPLPPPAPFGLAAAPPDFRLTVRPASDRAPQATKLKANVYSSVEISFRTIL